MLRVSLYDDEGIDEDLFEVLSSLDLDPWVDFVRAIEAGHAWALTVPLWHAVRAARAAEPYDVHRENAASRAYFLADEEVHEQIGRAYRPACVTPQRAKQYLLPFNPPGQTARRLFAFGAMIERTKGGPIGAHLVEAARLTLTEWDELVLAWSTKPGRRAGHWPLLARLLAKATGVRTVPVATVRARWERWKKEHRKR